PGRIPGSGRSSSCPRRLFGWRPRTRSTSRDVRHTPAAGPAGGERAPPRRAVGAVVESGEVISPRLRRLSSDEPAPLPLPPGPVSNGEFVPGPITPRDLAIQRAVEQAVDAAARRAGIDRRRFLRSAGGVAASLAVYQLAACSGSRRGAPPSTPARSGEH